MPVRPHRRKRQTPWRSTPGFVAGVASIGAIGGSVDHLIEPVSSWEALGRDFGAISCDLRQTLDAVVAEAETYAAASEH